MADVNGDVGQRWSDAMSFVVLTENNTAALKKEIRRLMPSVKSAHLTEAIAAALEFKSHAALLSHIHGSGKLPDVAHCDQLAFITRLNELGYELDTYCSIGGLARSGVLPEPMFAEFKNGDRAANNAQYHLCLSRGWPMITIARGRTYATMSWDYITMPSVRFPHMHRDNGRPFVAERFRQFQEHAQGAPGKPYFMGSASAGSITKLLPDTARSLAELYFMEMYLPMRANDPIAA